MGKKVKLSFSKFQELIHKHKYVFVSVYCREIDGHDEVKFIECRTPEQQKTFFVYVPDKFRMKPLGVPETKIRYISEPQVPSSRQTDYLTSVKDNAECDVVSVSSSGLCSYRDDNVHFFPLGKGEDSDDEDSDDEVDDDDEVAELERKSNSLWRNLQGVEAPKLKIKGTHSKKEPVVEESSDDESSDSEDDKKDSKEAEGAANEEGASSDKEEGSDSDSEEQGKVELVFKHRPSEEASESEDEASESEAEEAEDPAPQYDIFTGANELPDGIGEDIVQLGILYVLIDVNTFFKKIAGYESVVIVCYEQIEVNEVEKRKERVEGLKEAISELYEHLDSRLQKMNEKETNCKEQLLKLTATFTKISALKEKVSKNPEKYGKTVIEVDRVFYRTKKTINETNLEIARMRDEFDEFLTNYDLSLHEIRNL